MKYYAVIDTNVLASALLKYNSVPGSVVELALNGPIIPVVNDVIVEEYRKVLLRPKFHLSEDLVEDIINAICTRSLFINEDKLPFELPDPKNLVFYEVVMEKRKEDDAYLITGNIKHFPAKPFIVTPREMLGIILNDPE